MENNMSSMNYFVIEYICIAYNEGRFDDLARMGVPQEIAAELAKLSMLQVSSISRFRAPIFNIQANMDNFKHLLNHFNRETERNMKTYDLIKRGATFSVISELAGTTRAEFNALCTQVGVDPKCNSGKPRNLSDTEIEQQLSVMATLQKVTDPLERFWLMMTQTNVPAGPVWRWLQTGGE